MLSLRERDFVVGALALGASHARILEMSPSWGTSIFPGLAIFVTIVGVNLLGDGIRDAYDPKLRRGV